MIVVVGELSEIACVGRRVSAGGENTGRRMLENDGGSGERVGEGEASRALGGVEELAGVKEEEGEGRSASVMSVLEVPSSSSESSEPTSEPPEDPLIQLARGALGQTVGGASTYDATRAPPIGRPASELQQLRDMIKP